MSKTPTATLFPELLSPTPSPVATARSTSRTSLPTPTARPSPTSRSASRKASATTPSPPISPTIPRKAPVTFLASGYAPGAVANTSVSGQVLDNANQPITNATVRLLNTTLSATTDTNGNFSISGAPVGTVTLSVDGSTSTSTQTFPFLSFVLESLPGQNNTLNKPIFLPSIDADNAQTVGGDDPVTITMANVPGVSFTVAPHSVTFPDGTTVGKLSVSQVNSNMIPMEPTNGSSPNLIWTLQPAGARFSTPVTVTFPNTQGLAPGSVTEFYQYDHDLEQFVSAGTAHVSADGSTLLSDAGFGITKAGWGHILTSTDPGTCVESCISSDPCITAKLFANCVCATFANPGAACGKHDLETIIVGENPDGSDRTIQIEHSCKLPGKCDNNGKCTGQNSPAGTGCKTDNYCDIGGKCNGNGTCIASGTVQPVQQIDNNGDGLFANAQLNLSKEVALISKVLSTINDETEPLLTIQPSVTGQNTKTKVCCEATKMMNVENDDSTITPGVTLQTGLLPVATPVTGPLSYTIPGFGKVGIFWRLGGSMTGTYKKSVDNCANKNCTSFGISPTLTVSGILQFGTNEYVTANLTASIGLTLGASLGCGTISLTGGPYAHHRSGLRHAAQLRPGQWRLHLRHSLLVHHREPRHHIGATSPSPPRICPGTRHSKGSFLRTTLQLVTRLASLAVFTPVLVLVAQTTQVARPATPDVAPVSGARSFDYSHLKDRPYTFGLPTPSFPSSARVQREFVVEYLYDYATSTYTPEVSLPIVPVAQFKRDTPENALIALFSAMAHRRLRKLGQGLG